MDIVVIATVSLFASGLTLFSGFGLGTLLMPAVAIFFPVDVAIAITAIVHFANNIFKLALLGLHADKDVVIKFGVPAVLAAFLGAFTLGWLSSLEPIYQYSLMERAFMVMPVKLIIGFLIIIFVLVELSKTFSSIKLDKKFLPFGGCLSGFLGGLSGHQGAFRSMFLLKAGLSKEQFIATGVVLAVIVDMSRILIYGWDATTSAKDVNWLLVAIATLSAFIGAFVGARLMKKMTINSVQMLVSILLVIVAFGMIVGIL
ncbi:MAG: sulfite exporter TauE/SafE family protein [Desulfamplus sp.]|nr:sulfite exporter TauE/SafE family protein [Desulfamplus sp.]